MKKIVKCLFSSLLILFLFSCNIGLGPAVDLQSPKVTVTKPEVAASIPKMVMVQGSASDNIAVTYIQVSIEETGQTYQLVPGQNWQKMVGDSWQPYDMGNNTVNGEAIDFTLYIDIDNAQTGQDYTIVTQAFDEMQNEGKESKDERVVSIDISAPTVTVSEPVLFTDFETAETQFNSFNLKDNTILTSLLNQDVTISGFQKEDSKLDRLVVILDAETTNQIPENENGAVNVILKKDITGSNIRNWNFVLQNSELPEEYRTGKHLFRIFTYSYDVAGNCEKKVQGWFVYWNEADIPWVTATFGEDTADTTKKTYPNCNLLGQAFDDDGLKEISITTKKIDGTVVNNLTRTISLDSENNPKYYTWSTNAIPEIGKFYVVVSCKDINGNVSESITKYLDVDDVTPPTIVVDSSAGLPLRKTDFTITGHVEDDGDIKRVLIVRKTSSINQEQEVEYLNGYSSAANNVWKLTTTGNDRFGNKMWVLNQSELSDKYFTEAQVSARDFSFAFDWQNDFDIKTDFSSNKLVTQTFIICAIDNNDMSRTSLVTLSGDSNKPEFDITEVIVKTANDTEKEHLYFSNGTPELQPFSRDNSGKITDKIVIKGTWRDDSIYLKDINFNWKDLDPVIANQIKIAKKSDGTWETSSFNPPDLTTAVLTAELEDLGGNVTNVTKSFYVNGAMAQFMRISSDQLDGHYSSGSINIYLEFTKNVKFDGGSENPKLLLSNGKYATYVSGNGTSSKHIFKYDIGTDVSENTNTNKLEVTKIVTNGNKWYDGNNCFWNTTGGDINGSEITYNLAYNRSIYIDNKAPTLSSITSVTQAGYYKSGTNIYISAQFSEDVNSDFTGLALQFNTGSTTTSVQKTGSKDLLFTYEVKSSDNVNPLQITGINWGTASIKDLAGNEINKTGSVTTPQTLTGIVLDNRIPSNPSISVKNSSNAEISGDGTKKVEYNSQNVTLTITYDSTETTGVTKYTTDYKTTGANNWSDYTSPITLTNGTYKIAAYQQDAAGNVSSTVTYDEFIVDYGELLKSSTIDKPAGTYGSETKFNITLNFRNKVTATNSKIKLNIGTNGKEIQLKSGNDTKQLVYEYTAGVGESCTGLKIIGLSGTYNDEYGNDISSLINYTKYQSTSVSRFDSEKTIVIDTSVPSVSGVALSGTDLRITFTTPISKGTGDVKLTMANGTYRAPAYFTKDEWSNYSSNSTIANYYEKTTQGCDENGKADLSEKYVLKFDYSTIGATALINALKSAGADKASMSVNSSDVDIEGDTLVLHFGTKIPVKGATYNVTIPANLVQNSLGKKNAEDTSRSVTLDGVEEPIIRIRKSDSTITKNTDNSLDIELPIDAAARIDCQTPGATITYQLADYVSTGINMENDGNSVKMCLTGNTNKLTSAPSHTFSYGTSYDYTNSATFVLSAGTNNDYKGYQVRIKATASKGGGTPVEGYEQAMKTVIAFINSPNADGYAYRALRGGDNTYGGVSTPGFPLSWNTTEKDKIQTMSHQDAVTHDGYVPSNDGTYVLINGNYEVYNRNNQNHRNKQRYNWGKIEDSPEAYYWVTWKLTTTAYVNILATDGSSYSDGYPSSWWWASCGWVPDVKDYPIYPGETSTLDADKQTKNGGFQFMNKHKQAASSN